MNTANVGGALLMADESYLYSVSSLLQLNFATLGGALFIEDNQFFLKVRKYYIYILYNNIFLKKDVQFISNEAVKQGNGGSVYLASGMKSDSNTKMTNIVFHSSSAFGGAGGALFWSSSSSDPLFVSK